MTNEMWNVSNSSDWVDLSFNSTFLKKLYFKSNFNINYLYLALSLKYVFWRAWNLFESWHESWFIPSHRNMMINHEIHRMWSSSLEKKKCCYWGEYRVCVKKLGLSKILTVVFWWVNSSKEKEKEFIKVFQLREFGNLWGTILLIPRMNTTITFSLLEHNVPKIEKMRKSTLKEFPIFQ